MRITGDDACICGEETPSLSPSRDPFARRARFCLLLFFGLTVLSGALSDGVYHEDDLQHFLLARWSQHDARYLLDWWGRPGFTVPYALPAMIGSPAAGLAACRLLSAVLSAATAWLAYRIARHFRLRHAWLAIPLVYLQPMFTHLSLTSLTETPLAFYFALATWWLLRGKPVASAAVMALAPLTRHEAIVLLGVWAVALWYARAHWGTYPILLWALAAQNLFSAATLGHLPITHFLEADGVYHYGHGTPLTFVWKWVVAAGALTAILAIMGTRRLWPRPLGWIIVVAPLIYWLTETAVYMKGAYSSGGYARFLVPMAPWLAVLAVAGAVPIHLKNRPASRLAAVRFGGVLMIILWVLCEIEWLCCPPIMTTPQRWAAFVVARIGIAGGMVVLAASLYRIGRTGWADRKTLAWRYVTLVGVATAIGGVLWALMPLQLATQHRLVRQAVEPLKQSPWPDRPLLTANCWVYYWTDRWAPIQRPTFRQAIAQAEPGTLFAWDARFCLEHCRELTYEQMAKNGDWRLVWASSDLANSPTPFLASFERQGAIPAAAASPAIARD